MMAYDSRFMVYGCVSWIQSCKTIQHRQSIHVGNFNACSLFQSFGTVHEDLAIRRQHSNEKTEPQLTAKVIMELLGKCTDAPDIQIGNQMHMLVVLCDMTSNIFIGSALINMYAIAGSLEDAQNVFETMPRHDVVSWNSLITGYAKHGNFMESINLYLSMSRSIAKPNDITFMNMLNLCAKMKLMGYGNHIHSDILEHENKGGVMIYNSLIDMYGKCGSVEDAWHTFCSMHEWNLVSWNVIIAAHAKNGLTSKAIELFHQMRFEGLQANEFTFATIFGACSMVENLQQGKQIHTFFESSGVSTNSTIDTAVLDFYANCGSILDAHFLFERMCRQDVISWNVLITAYAKLGLAKEAFALFVRIFMECLEPNDVTFIGVCSLCGSECDLRMCRLIHMAIVFARNNFGTSLDNALVDAYVKCGSPQDAYSVFDKLSQKDVISWTAIIGGCIEHELFEEGWALFNQMQLEVIPNEVTFLTVLNADIASFNILRSKQVQCQMVQLGLKPSLTLMNTLIDMYAKCGFLDNACKMFEESQERDIVSWNSIITGYAKYGQPQRALESFLQLKYEGMLADDITYMVTLNACTTVADLEQGFRRTL